MQTVDICADGKRNCIAAIQRENDHITWLKSRGFSDDSEWVNTAKESLNYWIDMLQEWESLQD